MIFNGLENQTVELKITNYEFPEIKNDYWDSNWLNLYLKVKSKDGHWQTVNPFLTTWEVRQLLNWFLNLSKDKKPQFLDMRFTEPNLFFELLNAFDSDSKLIRIKFGPELRPQSAIDEKDYFVDCWMDNQELERVYEELKSEHEKYPER